MSWSIKHPSQYNIYTTGGTRENSTQHLRIKDIKNYIPVRDRIDHSKVDKRKLEKEIATLFHEVWDEPEPLDKH